MIQRDSLPFTPTDRERFEFEITHLRQRVSELEDIVHELLRGRINKEIADGWRDTARNPGLPSSTSGLKGRGAQIADVLDRFEGQPSQQWPEKEEWSD